MAIRRKQSLLIPKLFLGTFFGCCLGHRTKWYFDRAPEPSDIYWENLGHSTLRRIFRTTISYMLSLILLCVGIGIISSVKVVQIENMKENAATHKQVLKVDSYEDISYDVV